MAKKATTKKQTVNNSKKLTKDKLFKIVLPIAAILLVASLASYFLGRSSAAGNLEQISVIKGHNCIQQSGKKLPTVSTGSQGECVKAVQIGLNNRLAFISWVSGGKTPYKPIATDGVFGPTTKQAVIDFQNAHKLTADGVVGTATWNELLSDCTVTATPCVVSNSK